MHPAPVGPQRIPQIASLSYQCNKRGRVRPTRSLLRNAVRPRSDRIGRSFLAWPAASRSTELVEVSPKSSPSRRRPSRMLTFFEAAGRFPCPRAPEKRCEDAFHRSGQKRGRKADQALQATRQKEAPLAEVVPL